MQNTHDLLVGTLSIGIPSLYMLPRDNDSLMMLVKCFSLDNWQQKYTKIETYKKRNQSRFENIPGGRAAILLFCRYLQI